MENKNFLSKVGFFFKWLVLTNLGRILLAFLWILTFMGLDSLLWNYADNYGGWLMWVGMAGVVYLVGFTLVAIVYGWIINPIRDWKERKKRQGK